MAPRENWAIDPTLRENLPLRIVDFTDLSAEGPAQYIGHLNRRSTYMLGHLDRGSLAGRSPFREQKDRIFRHLHE